MADEKHSTGEAEVARRDALKLLRSKYPKLEAEHEGLVSDAILYALERWDRQRPFAGLVVWKAEKLALDRVKREKLDREPPPARAQRHATETALREAVREECRRRLGELADGFDVSVRSEWLVERGRSRISWPELQEQVRNTGKKARAVLKAAQDPAIAGLVEPVAGHASRRPARDRRSRHPGLEALAEWKVRRDPLPDWWEASDTERACVSILQGNWPRSVRPGEDTVAKVIEREAAAIRAARAKKKDP